MRTILDILVPQMEEGDQHLIIGDGQVPEVQNMVKDLGHPGVRYTEGPQTRMNGNAQRELGMRLATTDWLCFLDDSMHPMPDMLPNIRTGTQDGPRLPHLFRISMMGHGLRWKYREWRLGTHEVNAAMLVTPNDKDKLGSWHLADNHEGKSPYGYPCPKVGEWNRAGGYFLDATIKNYGEEPIWRGEVISIWFD